MMRSSVLLAACLGLWSCTNDPTADEAGVPTAIVASPLVNFVTQGTSQLITFGLVDELGGLIPSTWTISGVSPEISVAFDSTYRVIYKNGLDTLLLPDMQSQIRVTVTGVSSGVANLTVTAGGVSQDVKVSVVPSQVAATFNTTTPDIGEELVLTMPSGLSLLPTATFSAGTAAPPIVVSLAPDGSSATLLVAPGTSSPITIAGVTPDFAALNLSLNTTETITATSTSTFTGTDDPTTAPTITLPGVGETIAFYDIPAYVDQFYKLVITDSTTVTVGTDWADHSGDIDQLWMNSSFAVIPPFSAATGAAPESSTATLAPGTYYFFADIYDGAPGGWYKFTITVVSQP